MAEKMNTLYESENTSFDTHSLNTNLGNGSLESGPFPNGTDESTDILPDIRQPVYMVVIYCLAYGVIFLLALFGNIAVVAVVTRTRRLHTLTNFFIGNLAIADMLVAVFCMPITLLESLYNGWRYGAFLCKLTPYLQGVSVCTSVNLLAAIAADRYLAICYTLEHKMTWRIGKILVSLIWVLSFTLMIPWLLYYEHKPHTFNNQIFYLCHQEWPVKNGETVFFLVIIIVCYLVPLILIIICYALIGLRVSTRNAPGIFRYSNVIQKSKVKVIKMLALIVFLFAISWLPLYTIFLVLTFNPPDPNGTSAEFLMNVGVPIAQWLGHSNSGINPIIYCFFSKTIRKRIVAMLQCSSTIDLRRRQSRFSSTRLMSVDYSNGQIILRLNKRRTETQLITPCTGNGHLLCESTFYD